MAFKINGVVRIDNSGNGFLGVVTATDANITGVVTASEIDAKVSSKAISEQTDGTVDDVTGADELLLLDAETGSLLRVSVGEFIEGAGIGTILTELNNLTVTGITTVNTLKGIGTNPIALGSSLTDVVVSGMLTADRFRSGDIAARNVITLGITTIQDHLEVNDSTGSGTEYNLNVKTNGSSTFGVLGNGNILLGNSAGAPFMATNDHHATSKKYVDEAVAGIVTSFENINVTGVVTANSFVGDGSQLNNLRPSSISTSTEPTTRLNGDTLQSGDLWYDSSKLRQFTYYNDGGSVQWVSSSPQASVPDFTYAGNTGIGTLILGEDTLSVVGDNTNVVTTASGVTSSVTISLSSDVAIAGSMTAANFYGDGTNLTGVGVNGVDISPRNLKVTGISTFVGVVTTSSDLFVGGDLNVLGDINHDELTGRNLSISGISTLSGQVNLGDNLVGDTDTNISGINSVTATSFYGDGSQLTGTQGGVANFVASGSIPNGTTVIIKEDGTIEIVDESGGGGLSSGNPVQFESGKTIFISATYDSTNNKVVIAYQDDGNSDYGTSIVGTVSGNSISFGTPVVFNSAATDWICALYDSSNNKVVIGYRNSASSARAIVGTVSGTSISFGTSVTFGGNCAFIKSAYDSTNSKVVFAYKDGANSGNGTAIVGTVSGTSISFGSAAVFNTSRTDFTSITYDSTNEKLVIAYKDFGNSKYGTAIVGTISGTSISFGTASVFESATSEYISTAYDSTNNKVVIAYEDNDNSARGTAVVGTVSGTSISFGSPVIFETDATSDISVLHDSTNNRIIIAYSNGGSNGNGTALEGSVSGNSISFSPSIEFQSSGSTYIDAICDSSAGLSIVAYQNAGNLDRGTAVILNNSGAATNLTSENFIGISAESISDGDTGKINIVSGINRSQTGLTTARTYYVQGDGTLALTPGSPSVVAGTSISSTEILVR